LLRRHKHNADSRWRMGGIAFMLVGGLYNV